MGERTTVLMAHASIPLGLLLGVVPVVVLPLAALMLAHADADPLARRHARAAVAHLARALGLLASLLALLMLVGPHIHALAGIVVMTAGVGAGLYLLVGVPLVAVVMLARGSEWRYPLSSTRLPAPVPAAA